MTVLYQDTFTGSGDLSTHVSDSGHTYTDFDFFLASDFLLSGGSAGIDLALVTGAGARTTQLVPLEFKLTVVVNIGTPFTSVLDFAELSFFFHRDDFSSEIFIDRNGITLDLEGAPGSTGLVAGSHTFELLCAAGDMTWSLDGVPVASKGAPHVPLDTALPFIFIIGRGGSPAFSVDSITLEDFGAPPPGLTPPFWTAFRGSHEEGVGVSSAPPPPPPPPPPGAPPATLISLPYDAPVPAGDGVAWYKFVVAVAGDYHFSTGTSSNTGADTFLAIYGPIGDAIWFNDDGSDVPGFLSHVAFTLGTEGSPYPPGTYYVSVSMFPTTTSNGWGNDASAPIPSGIQLTGWKV